MRDTLHKRYQTRKAQLIKEHIDNIDKQLLKEQRTVRLLIEAMSNDDLNKVSAIIDKFAKIKSPELKELTKAIEQAEAEVNKYTSGGMLSAAWTKLKGLVGINNPIVKIMTFASALERGFSQIPTILKNNGITKLSKTGDQYESVKATLERTDPEHAEQKASAIASQFRKALSPTGIYGVFKKVPYIDSEILSNELINAPLSAFALIATALQAGPTSSEIAPDLQAQVSGKEEPQQTGTAKQGEPATPSEAAPTQQASIDNVTSQMSRLLTSQEYNGKLKDLMGVLAGCGLDFKKLMSVKSTPRK